MPVTRDTLRLMRELKIRVAGDVDQVTGELVRAWARLWNELAADWESAVTELVVLAGAGVWPSRGQLRRARRVRDALALTREALEELALDSRVTIVFPLAGMVDQTVLWEAEIIASQYPPTAQIQTLVASLDRVDQGAIEAIVRRTTEQVTSLTRPLAADAYSAVLSELVRGVALGTNPKVAARQMLRRTETAFNGGLTRAMRIARTELLDAHRAAAAAQHQANTDVLRGWAWVSSLSRRTCPACLAMHGSEHPLSEPGPEGHVNCRCARAPLTRSWRDLGFAIEEPASVFPDAQAWFDGQPRSVQVAIMGPTRLGLLESGTVSWDDLAVRQQHPGWRPSYQPRPLRDLRNRRRQSA